MSEIGFKPSISKVNETKQVESAEKNTKIQTTEKPKDPSVLSKGDKVEIKAMATDKPVENISLFNDEPIKETETQPEKTGRKVTERKGTLSVAWGYGWQHFAPSDIRFHGEGHDFTLHDVKAYDRPSEFSFNTYFNPAKLSIPQYMIDINYFVTDNVFLRLGQHHMKYVMDDNQMTPISGHIDASADPNNAGIYTGQHIPVNNVVQKFEHTDGLNDVHIGVGMVTPLWESKNGKHALSMTTAATVGAVIPRTDARVFNQGYNHNFHLSGYSLSGTAGVRVDLFKHFFVEGNINAGHINLTDIITTGGSKAPDGKVDFNHDNGPNRAAQKINYINNYFTIGANIPINTGKK